MNEHCHRLAREVVDSLSLESSKNYLDIVLGNQLCVALLEQRGLDLSFSRDPFQHQPFCDSFIQGSEEL